MDLLNLLIILHLLDRRRGAGQQIEADGQDALDGFWWVLLGCGVMLVVPCLLLFVIGVTAWVLEAIGRMLGR